MVNGNEIDFWFSMGSTYTYLSVMRLPTVQQANGIKFRWRPFYLLKLFQETNYHPFAGKPAKLAYMWRDIERRAGMHGIPLRVPAPYPLKESALANRIAHLGMRDGWGEVFVRASYRRWFQNGEATAEEPNLSGSLRESGQDPQRVLNVASSAELDQALEEETNEARRLGICGSPTFAVGGELFWGDDRLEDAVTWYRRGTLASQ